MPLPKSWSRTPHQFPVIPGASSQLENGSSASAGFDCSATAQLRQKNNTSITIINLISRPVSDHALAFTIKSSLPPYQINVTSSRIQ